MRRLELHSLAKKRDKGAVEMKIRKESDEEKLKVKKKNKGNGTEVQTPDKYGAMVWHKTKVVRDRDKLGNGHSGGMSLPAGVHVRLGRESGNHHEHKANSPRCARWEKKITKVFSPNSVQKGSMSLSDAYNGDK